MIHCFPNSEETEKFIWYLVALEKERDRYKEIAEAYRDLKNITLETCPESYKKTFKRKQQTINLWEKEI